MSDHTLSSAPETALAARVEAAAEVEASHGPDGTGFACRGCGWAYVGEINACPPVLMARAGLPELAGTITYGGGPVECMADALTDQIGELSALVGQLREDVWAVHDTADEVLGEVLPGRAGLLPWPGWRRAGLAVAHLVGGVGVAVLLARVLWPALPGPLPGRRWGWRVPEDVVQAAADLVAGLTYPQLFAEGFRYVQVLDQYGVVVATYTHGGPAGVGVCPECTADATAVAR